MAEAVIVERIGSVEVISFNRPHRHNAIDDTLQEAFWQAIIDAVDDAEVRALLLRGEGPSFSSGRDTASLGQHDDHGLFALVSRVQEAARRLLMCPKPVVAAMKGHVLGLGLEIALAADVRLVARGASLGFPEVNFGIITDNGGAGLATLLAGPARAKYLVLSGQTIDAEQALAWGLAEWLVEVDELDERSLALATRFASRPPIATRFAKALVDGVHRGALLSELGAELPALMALYATEDRVEARAADGEKRPPMYRGR